jgi:LysM repeat protein
MKNLLNVFLAVLGMALIIGLVSGCASNITTYEDGIYSSEKSSQKSERQRVPNTSYETDIIKGREKDYFSLTVVEEIDTKYCIKWRELSTRGIEIIKIDLNGQNTQIVFDGKYDIKDAKSVDYLLLARDYKKGKILKDTLSIDNPKLLAKINKRLKKQGKNRYSLNERNINFPEFSIFQIPELNLKMWYFNTAPGNPEKTYLVNANTAEVLVNPKTGKITFVDPNGIYRWYNFENGKRKPFKKEVEVQNTNESREEVIIETTMDPSELEVKEEPKKETRKERKKREKLGGEAEAKKIKAQEEINRQAEKEKSNQTSGLYIVKPRDTGYQIATKTKVPFKKLKELNPGVIWKDIREGDKIKIKE